MFAQVFQGPVSDEAEAQAAMRQWQQDLAPGAQGWLGSTSGVTEDGQFIAIARFEDEASARRNSERPEQGAWWAQTSKLFTADPTFTDSIEVAPDLVGNPDEAGFVQIIQGKTTDQARARELMAQDPDGEWAAFRPDILGSAEVDHAGGGYTMVLYFTSEAEAREGESKPMPAQMQAQMEEMQSLNVGEPTFLDLKRPLLLSPR